ncbi:MAG: ribokinase [Pseudoclavibacter sp.]
MSTRQGRQVFVFGSANQDHVLSVTAFPNPGETVIADSSFTGLGGKGANQAVASARQGALTTFIGAIGADTAGDALIDNLRAQSVKVDAVVRDSTAATGTAIVLVDRNGDNEIIVAPGANASLSEQAVERALRDVGDSDIVVVQCEISPMRVEQVIRGAAQRGAYVIVNLAPYTPLNPVVFADIGLLVLNESEARALTRSHAPDPATAAAETTGCACLVTLGAQGSTFAAPDGRTSFVQAAPVDAVIDTTGAGDTYVGALAASLAAGADIQTAMSDATAASGEAVQTLGAQGATTRTLIPSEARR